MRTIVVGDSVIILQVPERLKQRGSAVKHKYWQLPYHLLEPPDSQPAPKMLSAS